MLHSGNSNAIKAHGSKTETMLNEQFRNLNVAYFKARSNDYGNMARQTFKRYENANSQYRELVALRAPKEILEAKATEIRAILADYHRYGRLSFEFGTRSC